MKTVSRFESNLILILRCLLRRVPLERALPLILRKVGRPRCLSRTAVELVQDSLAKGLPLLAARGGWRKERFLRNGQTTTGRVWERSSNEERGLRFSAATLEWLIWLTTVNPAEEDKLPEIDPTATTAGDSIFFYFAFDRLEESRLAGPLLKQPWFARHALLQLAFPDRFAESGIREVAALDGPAATHPSRVAALDGPAATHPSRVAALDGPAATHPSRVAALDGPAATHPSRVAAFTPWLEPQTVWLLEALQDRLAERWIDVERRKREFSDGRKLQSLGDMQQRVLERFFQDVEQAGRKDLARFLLCAANEVLDGPDRSSWFPKLDVRDLRLADRTDVYRDGLSFLRALSRLQQWEQSARSVGYYDEGYAAGQLWKADWERWNGTSLCTAAAEIIRCTLPFQV
jgi:hypothetical protein